MGTSRRSSSSAGARPRSNTRSSCKRGRVLHPAGFTSLEAPDVAFCCLGTTIKKAGSREAFRAVDYDAVLTFANAARAKGARAFLHVSLLGADPRSRHFYYSVKGEIEATLQSVGFDSLKEILGSGHVEMLRLPARSPNLNAYAERFVGSIKSECLRHIVPIGERHLRAVVREYVEHYHQSGRPARFPQPAPHRSGRAPLRIRLFGSRIRCSGGPWARNAWRRKRVPLKKPLHAFPRHARTLRAAVKPRTPRAFNLVPEARE